MILCPSCGVPNPDRSEYCVECLGELPRAGAAVPDRPAAPGAEAASAPAAAAAAVVAAAPADASGPVPRSTEVPAGVAVCPKHPEMPAAGTCSRCGRFYCLTCVPEALVRKSSECPDCAGSRDEREAPQAIAQIIKEMWIAQLVIAFVIVVLIGVVGALVRDATDRFTVIALAGTAMFFAIPFLVCAAVIATTRSVWSVWIGFALEVVVFGVLGLMSTRASCMFLVSVLVPLYTLVRVLTLQRLVKAYPQARQRAV